MSGEAAMASNIVKISRPFGCAHQLPRTGSPTMISVIAGTGPFAEARTTPCLSMIAIASPGFMRFPSLQTLGAVAPSLDEFAEIAEAALAEIPAEFKRHIEGVALRVDDWPDQGTLRRMRIRHPLGLLGLY